MLIERVTALEENGFTGRLEIKSIAGVQCRFYFLFGRIFWAEGGEQSNRFWRLHLSRYNLKPNQYDRFFLSKTKLDCSNHHYLTELLEEKKITLDRLITIVREQIQRILFEFLQLEKNQTLKYDTVSKSGDSILGCCGLKISLIRLNTKQELAIAKERWQNWCDRGFEEISPNFAPIIKDRKILKGQVSPQVYQNFVRLLDGNRTLQELAIQLQRDVLELTTSLKQYIEEGSIELIKIADLSESEIKYESEMGTIAPSKLLIACIDDSPATIQITEKIVRHYGYDFIGIKEPLQAIPRLIVSQPDLILLDVAMPIVNGYELCSQLKRVKKLENTPIIMLTGQTGITDRVRAKICGAAAFLSKPIELLEIRKAIEKFVGDKIKANCNSVKVNSSQLMTSKTAC